MTNTVTLLDLIATIIAFLLITASLVGGPLSGKVRIALYIIGVLTLVGGTWYTLHKRKLL